MGLFSGGGLITKVTDTVGLTDSGAAEEAAGQQNAYMQKVLAQLEKIELPDIEKQRIALQLPKIVGQLQAIEQGDTALGDIAEEAPELAQAKMNALRALSERGEVGLTEEDKVAFNQARREIDQDAAARNASILQSMARRGMQDSGSGIAAQLLASQSSAQQASEAGDRLTSNAIQARRDALAKSAEVASGISQQQYGRDAATAQARDQISQFNILNQRDVAARNLAEKQRLNENQTALRNEQQMYNTGLQQQKFSNEMAKAGASGGAITNIANMYGQRAQAQAQKDSQTIGALAGIGAAFAGKPG